MSPTLKPIIKELGAGLILRRSSPEDAEALAAFCGEIHSEEAGKSDPIISAWTRDLLTRPHPRFHPDDFTVIEKTSTGRIVSTSNLISQTWTYEGIPFGVGRPELVGTLPEYRNRGLIRLQFEEIHRWSEERGELVQAITGIPYYYRLFGYEMAIDLDGCRAGFAPHVPQLRPGQSEAYTFRAATDADLPFIASTYGQGHNRYPIACVRDQAIWHYELSGRDPMVTQVLEVIEDRRGRTVGILRYLPQLMKNTVSLTMFELVPGVSWLEITPAVIRYLWKVGQAYSSTQDSNCMAFRFALGEAHPAYEACRERLPQVQPSYAWYVRVPDLPRFIKAIAPALEQRLAGSIACGYSGEVRMSFYRSGLRWRFEQGRLAEVEPWMPGERELEGDIAFPGLTFLQLLFGYRSLANLRAAFPDCWYNSGEARVLMEALFPRKPSQVIGLS
ncbi:MAG TPA: GNAT family N-acetyltransferase [Anaerolineales bacterium]|nr:GNAT family N-acetyltransferase [Anaerolineales bacterium]